ncbi:hypothetical protein EIKCOROL_01979 [Eikenella corrodens ATCC 23834]|uniref:Uncharacterized protein n=1 Tax=Eikenella corrodens ATCC 23834 TaxID=546274 RepID=C0DX76_EIKCO|nr:hypothetical protein EIKCOROL_01979 [Eikenella corrodens ATCC 23834]
MEGGGHGRLLNRVGRKQAWAGRLAEKRDRAFQVASAAKQAT